MEIEEGLWKDVMFRKYGGNGCLSRATRKTGDSQFWASLLNIKNIFYKFVKKEPGEGKNIRFWEDIWVEDRALKHEYPRLYALFLIIT